MSGREPRNVMVKIVTEVGDRAEEEEEAEGGPEGVATGHFLTWHHIKQEAERQAKNFLILIVDTIE